MMKFRAIKTLSEKDGYPVFILKVGKTIGWIFTYWTTLQEQYMYHSFDLEFYNISDVESFLKKTYGTDYKLEIK